MLRTLDGALVIITGASDGIGFEIARQAAGGGARTLMIARDPARLQAAAARIKGTHAPQTAAVDLTDSTALDALLADLDRRGIQPDMLVNNAGHGASGTFTASDWPKLDAMLRLNMLALARLSHWAARHMQVKGRGAIVNLSAAVATRPTPYFGALDYPDISAAFGRLTAAIERR